MGAPHDARLQLGILSHQLALERWSDAEVRRLARVLDANERDLVKRLGRLETATPLRRGRLQALFADLRQLNGRAYARLGEALTVSLRTLAAYESTFGQRLFDAVLPAGRRESLLPSPSQLRAIVEELPLVGSTLPKELSKLARSRFQRVQGMVRLGLVQNETNSQIIRRIVEGKKLGKIQAEALVRTAANHVSAQSREMIYAGHEDILAGVEWVATLDGRTTPICQALDGKVFKVNEGPRPPAHFRCRSATVPVTKSWEELGFGSDLPETLPPGVRLRPFVRDTRPVARIPKAERVGKIGQVRAEVHYSEWLAAQPSSFQDTVLGPKRGAIFRANPGMDLAKLMRTTYEPLTLAELAKVDGVIVEAVRGARLRENIGAPTEFIPSGPRVPGPIPEALPYPPEVRSAIDRFYRETARSQIEHGSIIDQRTGAEIARAKGARFRVDFGRDARLMRDRIVLHNHASGGSFSDEDLFSFCHHRPSGSLIGGISHDGGGVIYLLQFGERGYAAEGIQLAERWRSLMREKYPEFAARFKRRWAAGLDPRVAERESWIEMLDAILRAIDSDPEFNGWLNYRRFDF